MQHTLSGLAPRRKLLGFTQDEIAKRIGMGISGYARLERGERRTTFDKVIAISHFTGISLEDIQREPDEIERIELFKAGEQRRGLLEKSEGDEVLATTLEGWSEDDAA
jgi:transcriptional regulator with XRE-family HTH domain